MNIFAIEGHQVRCHTLQSGFDCHNLVAARYLKIGETYIVERTEVGGWYVVVYLKEFPGVGFNSKFFADEHEQPECETLKHVYFRKYLSGRRRLHASIT